jgi:hypothetical protein
MTSFEKLLTSVLPSNESTSARLVSHRILDDGDIDFNDNFQENYPQIELPVMETGIFRELGNVTNIGT